MALAIMFSSLVVVLCF